MQFATKLLSADPDVFAPDGAEVRVGLMLDRGSVARFDLAAGECSIPIRHESVDEIWIFAGGTGQMWRRDDEREEVVDVGAGTCVSVPVGTHFQFRSLGENALTAFAATMPPWPGDGEAVRVDGPWTPTVESGPGLA